MSVNSYLRADSACVVLRKAQAILHSLVRSEGISTLSHVIFAGLYGRDFLLNTEIRHAENPPEFSTIALTVNTNCGPSLNLTA
jgi:hypothetical protein